MLNKIVRLLLTLLGLVALVVFVVICVGIWYVKAEVSRRADIVLHEADHALDRAQPTARVIREAIEVANNEVRTTRPTAEAPHIPAIPKRLLRSTLQRSPEQVQTATRTVDLMSDLLVIAKVALDTIQDQPVLLPVNADELSQLREKVSSTSTALHQADAILQSTSGNPNATLSEQDSLMVQNALQESHRVMVDVEEKLKEVRQKVSTFRERLPRQLQFAAWAIFLQSLMGAIGQIALLRWCWSRR
jgi:hypothetical protein